MVLSLPSELTVGTVTEQAKQLLAALATGEALGLEAGAVCEVDVAGLQLLCAAQRSATAAGRSMTFEPGGRDALVQRAASDAGFGRRCAACAGGCLWQEVSRG